MQTKKQVTVILSHMLEYMYMLNSSHDHNDLNENVREIVTLIAIILEFSLTLALK